VNVFVGIVNSNTKIPHITGLPKYLNSSVA
jgi:hypothetical protein